jgi:hypothetical protein
MPWKTILVLIAIAVLAVVAYDIARYEHIIPDGPGSERDNAAVAAHRDPTRLPGKE